MDLFENGKDVTMMQKVKDPLLEIGDNAVNVIRCKMRSEAEAQRFKKRHEANDMLRCGLGEITDMDNYNESISIKEIVDLSEKLKNCREATCIELFRLSRAFILDEQYIIAFMSTPGAFQVIIKELTGRRADRQLSALQCICNISMGNANVCEKIISYAGSYLSIIIEGGSYEMKCTALWTLANTMSTSDRCVKKLIKINLITKLLNLYVNTDSNCPDVSSDAGFCLYLLIFKGASYLNAEHKCVIYEKFSLKNPYSEGAEYQFAILLHAGFFEMDCVIAEQQLIYLIIFIVNNIDYADNILERTNSLRVFYTVRALGNLIKMYPFTFTILKKELCGNRLNNFYNFMQKLIFFHDKFLNIELKWVIKNIKMHCTQDNEELSQLEALLDNDESVVME